LLAFNEPEASLHPDLLPGLSALLVRASRESQIWVTTHSDALAAALTATTGEPPLRLDVRNGATQVLGLNGLGQRLGKEPDA
jgi:predicted ATPase